MSDVRSYKARTSSHGMPNIEFKVNFEDEWRNLPERIALGIKSGYLSQRLLLTARKCTDLQSMKPVMPACGLHFFDNLPTE
ncbi:hypothetical protein RRG08_025046 [Elysia crispata]|uniref:Uncharacterized protein n=1 Tax=Elysia crispata TaxID=231223 RepID=A0AAE1E261_9GAST|nr:hypothetical protein RRG08_025046 [Elysia crispata]